MPEKEKHDCRYFPIHKGPHCFVGMCPQCGFEGPAKGTEAACEKAFWKAVHARNAGTK